MKVGLFPGQGIPAQTVLEALPENDEVLIRAGEILDFDLRRKVGIAARGSGSTLPTSLAQPAIFTAGVVALQQTGADGCDYFAGHSLGEYAALVAAGAISFEDGLGAVAVRGEVMQEAARSAPGGMAALMGLGYDVVQAIADKTGVVVANDNAPGQVVVSGRDEALAEAAAMVRSEGGRAVLLEVSGPFHSAAMEPAAPGLAEALDRIEVRSPTIPVISNVTARPYESPDEIRALLVQQVTHGVRWRESCEWLWDQGVRDFHDFGPGRVAAGLAQRTFRSIDDQKEAAGA
jgi:[acyl-carrier-protein] S-malonyltransferase